MEFNYTEEQIMLRDSVRSFVDKEIMPNIAEWDREGKFEPSIMKKLADLGLMGVCIPEKYGGSGMDYNSLAIVCEELERGDTACRTAVSVHTGLNSMSILQWGNEEQKQKYLVPQAKGEKVGAFGFTEPAAGSVKPNAPTFSPFACGTRYFCFCSSFHYCKIDILFILLCTYKADLK